MKIHSLNPLATWEVHIANEKKYSIWSIFKNKCIFAASKSQTMSTFTSTSYKAGMTGSVQGNSLTAFVSRDSTAGHSIYGGSNEQNKNTGRCI